jgi:hypothetical protein
VCDVEEKEKRQEKMIYKQIEKEAKLPLLLPLPGGYL